MSVGFATAWIIHAGCALFPASQGGTDQPGAPKAKVRVVEAKVAAEAPPEGLIVDGNKSWNRIEVLVRVYTHGSIQS